MSKIEKDDKEKEYNYKPHDRIRKEIDDVRNKGRIISRIIPNQIDKEEEEAAVKWWTSHGCFTNVENWDRLVELDMYYPNLYMVPTSIGTNIFIICPFCDEEKNVTNYNIW